MSQNVGWLVKAPSFGHTVGREQEKRWGVPHLEVKVPESHHRFELKCRGLARYSMCDVCKKGSHCTLHCGRFVTWKERRELSLPFSSCGKQTTQMTWLRNTGEFRGVQVQVNQSLISHSAGKCHTQAIVWGGKCGESTLRNSLQD